MMLKNLITPEIIQQYQSGEITQWEIAKMLNKREQAVGVFFRKNGIKSGCPHPPKNFVLRKQINFLRGCGNTQSTISRALGLSRQRISQIVREH